MKNQFLGLFLLSLFPASLFAQTVEQDTSVRQGKLKNGLTYYIRHNNKEAGLADFYIAQRVGSILEEPRQRGLAHFLEHMAFNGTKHFPGKGKNVRSDCGAGHFRATGQVEEWTDLLYTT